MSREFADARENRPDARSAMNRHNNEAGRQVCTQNPRVVKQELLFHWGLQWGRAGVEEGCSSELGCSAYLLSGDIATLPSCTSAVQCVPRGCQTHLWTQGTWEVNEWRQAAAEHVGSEGSAVETERDNSVVEGSLPLAGVCLHFRELTLGFQEKV